jgi:HD-like signal output (HDOD) protein
MQNNRSEIEERFKHLTNLPTLPDVASRCLRLINAPTTSSNDIAAVIGQDLSLSSKVLRLANSAFYGMPGTIGSINQAVVLLGLKVITTIILSATVFDMFPESKRSRRLFDRKAFWLHSLGCALIAKRLASRSGPGGTIDPEEAFCAGLLHDIGKVVLEQYLHEEFHAALNFARVNKIPLHDAERRELGFTHADLAGWLFSGWKLPPVIEQPVTRHHDPEVNGPGATGIALCHAADWLCYQIAIVIDPAYAAPSLDKAIADRLHLTPEIISELQTKIPEEIAQSSILFIG